MKKSLSTQYLHPDSQGTQAAATQYADQRTQDWINREELGNYLNRNEFMAYKESFETKLESVRAPIVSEIKNLKWVFSIALGIVTLILGLLFIIYPNMLNKDDARAIDSIRKDVTAFEASVNQSIDQVKERIRELASPKRK